MDTSCCPLERILESWVSCQNLDTCTQELKHNPAHPESFMSKSRRATSAQYLTRPCWRGRYRRLFPPRDFITPTTAGPQPPGADRSFEAPGAWLLSLVLLQGNGTGQVPAETC
ncbi:hypothetical protein QQF64_002177 [Cirrhinus molitorella]|uniref:Uncharacterized protein n=1 Tax=Cirrhinus molitorella TaxID=172907 RepID=A0ABR3MPE3_9TELE